MQGENNYNPEDLPTFLSDTGLRAVMTEVYGKVLGPEHSQFAFGGPMFFDVDGYWLDNLFGDLSSTSNGTLGTAQPLSAALNVGDTALHVGVSLGAVTTGSVIQISDGAASEIVTATAGSSGTAVLFANTPCRFAHSTSATAALETAAGSYTHKFAVLNSGTGQPPTHSLCDFTGITPTVGARIYPGACVAQMDITGQAGLLPDRKVSGVAWLSAPAASAPVANPSTAAPVAGWRTSITIGGSPVYTIGQWTLSLRRGLIMYFSAQGSQSPWIIPRGNLVASFTVDFTLAADESPLNYMLAGGQQALSITTSNGLAGARALSMTITASSAQEVAAKPSRARLAIGYPASWDAVSNFTDVGGSGGQGPVTVSLTNATATY